VLAKQEVFTNPLTSRLTTIWGGIVIDRYGDFISALCTAIDALHAGLPLLIYPEGTRSPTGKLLPFQRGAAKLALITGAPLIPIRSIGTHAIWPPKHHIPTFFNWKERQRLKIRIILGQPLFPPKNESGRSIEIQLTEQLRQAVADLGDSKAALGHHDGP
jgi:1-acyl-sn-glycerol-3-phosphate acyltransferase